MSFLEQGAMCCLGFSYWVDFSRDSTLGWRMSSSMIAGMPLRWFDLEEGTWSTITFNRAILAEGLFGSLNTGRA